MLPYVRAAALTQPVLDVTTSQCAGTLWRCCLTALAANKLLPLGCRELYFNGKYESRTVTLEPSPHHPPKKISGNVGRARYPSLFPHRKMYSGSTLMESDCITSPSLHWGSGEDYFLWMHDEYEYGLRRVNAPQIMTMTTLQIRFSAQGSIVVVVFCATLACRFTPISLGFA